MFIRLGNWGHRQESALVRRTAIVAATLGLFVVGVLWWLIAIPLFILLYPPGAALWAFAKAVAEIPILSWNQATSDARAWRRNWAGARRVWRAQKVSPTLSRTTGDVL